METRLFGLFLSCLAHLRPGAALAALALCVSPGFAWAAEAPGAQEQVQEQVIEPDIERRDIKLPKIDTEDWEIGLFGGVMSIEDFGSNAVYGARIAYHITEGLFVEGTLGQSRGGETSYEILSGSAQLLTDEQRDLTYYNVSLGYNILPGEAFITRRFAMTTDFYLIGGVGSTTFAGDDRYTVNFGAGNRLLFTDWLAVHVDFRDHIFDIDVTGVDKTTHNLELSAGMSIFF